MRTLPAEAGLVRRPKAERGGGSGLEGGGGPKGTEHIPLSAMYPMGYMAGHTESVVSELTKTNVKLRFLRTPNLDSNGEVPKWS